MKKISLFAAMITILLAAAACNKGTQGYSPSPTKLDTPEKALSAKKLVLDDNQLEIVSIEFTEGGRYIITKAVPVKSAANYIYITGTYTANGNTYTLNDFGTVTVDSNAVTINVTQGDDAGESLNVPAVSSAPLPETDLFVTLARTWKIDFIRISVNLNGSAVTVTKPGGDLPALAQELSAKGVEIDQSKVAGYIVDDVIFTRAKTFAVEFSEQDPLVGEFALDEDGLFNYEFNGSAGNSIISAKADGSVKWDAEEQQLIFIINPEISGESTSYKGAVIFYLSEAN